MSKGTGKLKVALFILAISAITVYIGNFAYAILSNQKGGTFGDTFGAANAFFSGGALVMLIYAIILQRDELGIVREERDDTRQILSGQEKINAQQKTALDRQAFEQSFYSLLSLISTMRQTASSDSSPVSPSTTLTTVSSDVRRKLRASEGLADIENTNSLHKLSSLAKLLITSHEILSEQNFESVQIKPHLSALRSFVDSQTAFILIPFVLRESTDPRKTIADLGVENYLDEQCIDHLKELLATELPSFNVTGQDIHQSTKVQIKV